MTNEHYLEVAKECGFDMMTIAPSIVIDAEQLSAYTARICAEKDAKIANFKVALKTAQDLINEKNRKLSAANAAIAMKDEALGAIASPEKHLGVWSKCAPRMSDDAVVRDIATKALSTTPESVAAWEAEKQKQWLDERKALIAMQAEALKKYDGSRASGINPNDYDLMPTREWDAMRRQALSTSAESVAAWEAEKLLPLQRQVAMLIEYAEHKGSCAKFDYAGQNGVYENSQCTCGLDVKLSDTQATAEAYDREHAAKVLEEASDDNRIDSMAACQLRIMAAELRAANKKENE